MLTYIHTRYTELAWQGGATATYDHRVVEHRWNDLRDDHAKSSERSNKRGWRKRVCSEVGSLAASHEYKTCPPHGLSQITKTAITYKTVWLIINTLTCIAEHT